MARVTRGAYAGHPTALSTSSQDLSSKGGIRSSSHLRVVRGLGKPRRRVQQQHQPLWVEPPHGHLSPDFRPQVTNCPLINTLPRDWGLCLLWLERAENRITVRMTQGQVGRANRNSVGKHGCSSFDL